MKLSIIPGQLDPILVAEYKCNQLLKHKLNGQKISIFIRSLEKRRKETSIQILGDKLIYAMCVLKVQTADEMREKKRLIIPSEQAFPSSSNLPCTNLS